jgi:hypothetical protein
MRHQSDKPRINPGSSYFVVRRHNKVVIKPVVSLVLGIEASCGEGSVGVPWWCDVVWML